MSSWRRLPTPSAEYCCSPPFSFFQAVVEPHFRAKKANRYPFHRICTLARRQKANHLVLECALSRPDVGIEIDSLDRACGGGGSAEATLFSFLKIERGAKRLTKRAGAKLLGQAVLINYRAPGSDEFTHSYVFEAILTPPDTASVAQGYGFPSTVVLPEGQFVCNVLSRTFMIRAVAYCQQNMTVHVCAHSCLRMALRSPGQDALQVSARSINELLRVQGPIASLKTSQIAEVINASGMTAALLTKMKPDDYLSELAALIDSGHMALLGFTTKGEAGHVVTVFGHSRNPDQWHPQAVRAYSGPKSAKYLPSSSWIDQFLIHDDNLGPYLSLGARSFLRRPHMQLNCVIGVLPQPAISSVQAEMIASTILRHLLRQRPLRKAADNYWLDYLASKKDVVILRSVLTDGARYVAHLKAARAHDKSRLDADSLEGLDLPSGRFWMVEFSLPPLYTGNQSKLGEVIISIEDGLNDVDRIRAIRLPGRLLTRMDNETLALDRFPLESHSALFHVG